MSRGVKQLFLLTLASLLMRGVILFFSAFLSRVIGAEGVGFYSLLSQVYTLAITFATCGIRTASTRLCTADHALNKNMRPVMRACCYYALAFGVASGGVLFVLRRQVSIYAVGQTGAEPYLTALALALPVISFSNVYCGALIAKGKILWLTAIQILEMVLKVSICCILLTMGSYTPLSGSGTIIALTGFCECFSLLPLLLANAVLPPNSGQAEHHQWGRVFSMAFPIGVGYALRNGLSSLEALMVPKGLMRAGGDAGAAMAVYGILHGMVFPALILPEALIVSDGDLLLPKLTAMQARGEYRLITHTVQRHLCYTLAYSSLIAGVFLCFGKEIAVILYAEPKAEIYFALLSPMCIMMYLDNLVDSCLKALGYQLAGMRYSMIDSILGIGMIIFLLPFLGIRGYLISLFMTKAINLALSLNKLLKVSGAAIPIGWSVCCLGLMLLPKIACAKVAIAPVRLGVFCMISITVGIALKYLSPDRVQK